MEFTDNVAKKRDPFSLLIFRIAMIQGIYHLNILVIGSVRGISLLTSSAANVYHFAENVTRFTHGKFTHRRRPIESLEVHKPLLYGKFDLVISNEYDPGCFEFCNPAGFYLTQVTNREEHDKGIFDTSSRCALLSDRFYSRWEHSWEKFVSAVAEKIKLHVDIIAKREGWTENYRFYLPDMEVEYNAPTSDDITVTYKGVRTLPHTLGLLELYNRTLSVYNPLFTTYTGVMDAYHKFPSTAFVAHGNRLSHLKELGFNVSDTPLVKSFAERIRKKYEFLTTPLMPPLPQQAFAYMKEGVVKAKADVPELGLEKGKRYLVRVGWQKRRDGHLKRGYMAIRVNGFTLFEDRQKDVENLIKAFGLPRVGSVETLYPDVLNLWRKKAAREFPQLVGFQIEDVALAATKPSVYIAHDRGMGKTLMAAAWAKLRGYKRVLVAAQKQHLNKWKAELEKFGFKYEYLLDWGAVRRLKEKIRAGVKNDDTVFYLCSFEFLSLEHNLNVDPWTCFEKDKRGYIEAIVKDIKTSRCPSCGKTVGQARKVCPNCGSTDYSGKYCQACETPSYTYRRDKPLTPEMCAAIETAARAGRGDFHSGTYPAYKKLKKLFKCVIIDEAQMVKNKRTLRSTAARSLHAKGRALVTANLMKNYPNELFWPVSWLLGFNNPMFPYRYHGGFSFFEKQFGTQIFRGKNNRDKEIWERIPEVSNLTILWKLIAPFMVRRLKEDIKGIPLRQVECVRLEMDDEHLQLYHDVRRSKLDELSEELTKHNPDARVIGANLWSLRAASTVPVAHRYFQSVDARFGGSSWSKLEWIVKKVKELKAEGEKVLIFSTLVDMADYVAGTLKKLGISALRIRQNTKNRFDIIQRFNTDSTTALISSMELIGRCFDIESASTVIFTDVGWTPEEHEQAMDRVHRIISQKPVTVYFLLNKGTIDEYMYELVIQKGETIKNVLDRRAVYQPADILREAVQIQVARRILIERPARPSAQQVKQEVRHAAVKWTPTPVVEASQLSLFGEQTAPELIKAV